MTTSRLQLRLKAGTIIDDIKPSEHCFFSLFKGADLKGIKVMIRDLDDVLFRDVGGKIAADGRYTAIVLTFY